MGPFKCSCGEEFDGPVALRNHYLEVLPVEEPRQGWAVFRDDGEQVSIWFDSFERAGRKWWTVYDHAEYLVKEGTIPPREIICRVRLGERTRWMNEDQDEATACHCDLAAHHFGDHSCEHIRQENA